MITVRNVLSGVSAALSEEFGDIEIYLDDVSQGLALPCFTVTCSPSVKQVVGKRFRRDFDICVHYFPVSEAGHGESGDVEERLFSAMRYINVDGDLLRGEDMSRKFSEGILSFNVRFGTFVLETDRAEVMEELESRTSSAAVIDN